MSSLTPPPPLCSAPAAQPAPAPAPAPAPPRDVLEALEQRRAKYAEASAQAKAGGDDRKARMHDRIAKVSWQQSLLYNRRCYHWQGCSGLPWFVYLIGDIMTTTSLFVVMYLFHFRSLQSPVIGRLLTTPVDTNSKNIAAAAESATRMVYKYNS